MIDSNDNPLTIQSADLVEQMKKLLLDAGFASPKAIEGIKLLGTGRSPSDTGRVENDLMPSLDSSGFPKSLETLLRIFIFGASVDYECATQAFLPMKIDSWISTGLLVKDENGVYAALQLMIYRNLAFAVDFKSDDITKNHVIGVTAATQTLEMLTVRRKVHSVLDIGTGTGIQAMIAAAHSDRVVATDINARAVNVAKFNAWLNGLDIDCRVGDRYEPVGDETFDLIISCPPFVISPDDRFHYVDSGHPGDQFLEKLISEGIPHLKEDGYLQVMCQVVQYGDKSWSERLASWLDGAGCDAWMLYRDTMSPVDHAKMWVPERSASSEKVLQEWVQYYEKNNITSITSGLLTIRKNSNSDNWFSVEQIPDGNGYCGHSIENGFRVRNFLGYVTDDEDMLDATLVFFEETEIRKNGNKSVLKLIRGLLFSEAVDDAVLSFLHNCNGEMTVGEAITSTEESSKLVIDKAAHLKVVRELVTKGFLLPV